VKKTRIYLDTSVISHLDAPDTPEKMAETVRLWKKLQSGTYDLVLSGVVFDELDDCSEPKKSYLLASLNQVKYERVEVTAATDSLAGKFIELGILKEKSLEDCLHIAAALISGCDIIVSWNFKHIVNTRTIKGAKVVAAAEEYKDIIICSPTMLLAGVENE